MFVCIFHKLPSDQFSSVTQSCLTLCNPMNCSTPGLPVHHHLLEFTRTLVQVADAIQLTTVLFQVYRLFISFKPFYSLLAL